MYADKVKIKEKKEPVVLYSYGNGVAFVQGYNSHENQNLIQFNTDHMVIQSSSIYQSEISVVTDELIDLTKYSKIILKGEALNIGVSYLSVATNKNENINVSGKLKIKHELKKEIYELVLNIKTLSGLYYIGFHARTEDIYNPQNGSSVTSTSNQKVYEIILK